MLSQSEFNLWCNQLKLSHQTQNLIQNIRTSPPSRLVGGGSQNVFGRYPSRKMGVTIQFESHKVELPFIYQLEHDDNVLEYYDQPQSIKLDYQGKNGRNLGVLHTPDFFVIKKQSAGWEECKTEEQLKKLSLKSPHRYLLSEDNQWVCPPGESYAKPFQLYYKLRSDSEINWNLQRNLVFLEDYLRSENIKIDDFQKQKIIKYIADKSGISLSELLNLGIIADNIYVLIIQEEIYFDLNNSLLAEPHKCLIFPNSEIAKAYALMTNSQSLELPTLSMIDLVMGTNIFWDGKTLTIVHVGHTEIILRGEQENLIQLKKSEFEILVKQGKINNLQLNQPNIISVKGWNKFYQASPEDQAEALSRYEAIKPYLQGEKPELENIPLRTIRYWKAKYLDAQQKYGCGYLGLLSHRKTKGNRERKLPEATLKIIEEFIEQQYETLKQKSKCKFDYGVRGIYRDRCGELVIESKVVAPALRRALESTLRHRHPDVFFIDEGQHLAKMSSGQKLQDQLDCLKSLANMTGILHCLIGTYELLTFRNLSGQLSRRSVDIHFPRYKLDNFDDVQAFKSVLLTFQCQMPVTETPNLIPHWEYFYERTLGCIGILKNWLTRALKDALDEDANTVTLKHLERRAWSVAQCQRMFKEIIEGERQLTETQSDIQNLRNSLGLGDESIIPDEKSKNTTTKRKKVGQRKPKRDSVGLEQDVI